MITEWRDPVTGVIYQVDDEWVGAARAHLAGLLLRRLNKKVLAEGQGQLDVAALAANTAGEFWTEEYYNLVFPLRFGRKSDLSQAAEIPETIGTMLFQSDEPEKARRVVLTGAQVRSSKEGLRAVAAGAGLPPVWPAMSIRPSAGNGVEAAKLVSDEVIIWAQLIGIVLRGSPAAPRVADDLIHDVRLGIFVSPFVTGPAPAASGTAVSKEQELINWLESHRLGRALAVGRFFARKFQVSRGDSPENELPPDLSPYVEVLGAIRDGDNSALGKSQASCIYVVAAVQRVKQYLFDSPGLNELRGASTILDELTKKFAEYVAKKYGPEMVIRAAGSTLQFFAPISPASLTEEAMKAEADAWAQQVRQFYYSATGTAFIAAGAVVASLGDIVNAFGWVNGEAHRLMNQDRRRADLPNEDVLPFEARCDLCRARAAEGCTKGPDDEPVLVCRPCLTKLKRGRSERGQKVQDVLRLAGITAAQLLGIGNEESGGLYASSLDELIPSGTRRENIAVIYGDGNNFGDIVENRLTTVAATLQWTRRVAAVTRAAVAIALVEATRWVQGTVEHERLERIPFQVLALGGDDISLITWSRLGLPVAERFLFYTDTEFANAPEEPNRISFSLGVVVSDRKAPIRRLIALAEDELMAWAKRAVRSRKKGQGTVNQAQAKREASSAAGGNVAFLVADSLDKLPDNVLDYAKANFLENTAGRVAERWDFARTLRPFSADELRFLLAKARRVRREGVRGPFFRLVVPFVRTHPLAAQLFYLYQKARSAGGSKASGARQVGNVFEVLECPEVDLGDWKSVFGLSHFPLGSIKGRPPLGDAEIGRDRTSPAPADVCEARYTGLWDLYEITKALE